MINLLTGSLAIILGPTSVLTGASAPTEQSPGVATSTPIFHKKNAETDNAAGLNSSACVTEQKSVSGVPVLILISIPDLLRQDWNVEADLWSCPSFTELARDGNDVERWNRLHPEQPPRKPYVAQVLGDTKGPIIASSDYMRALPEQMASYLNGRLRVLGADGRLHGYSGLGGLTMKRRLLKLEGIPLR